MERAEILDAMRRTADENGGRPLGMARFERATGIGTSDWMRYWPRFGDVQRDAGFAPNQLQGAYKDAYLFEKLIAFTREQRKFPTSKELVTKAHTDTEFPSHTVFPRRFGSKSQMVAKLAAYCADKPEYTDVVKILEPLVAVDPSDGASHDVDVNNEKPSYGFVYLVKGHPDEYKIGHTKLVDRRLSELGATASIKHELVYEIKTDDPSGVEAYWHKRLEAKRMRGEWFKLSAADVKAFKRWKRLY
ncbi:MAG TPA: GIY-YIG nuclease family protein [Solirubrobacteraceae bacterium]|jgi:hypothetical protein